MHDLNEAGKKLVMGLDPKIIADKMLDGFNRYRQTGDEVCLENARKFAAVIDVDSDLFPALFRREEREPILLPDPGR